MEINSGINIGASIYAMRKALEMPNVMMSLVQNSTVDNQTLGTKSPISQPIDVSAVTGKGEIIDLVA